VKAKRPTIKDVAYECGVSVTTVSEALNGKGRVADSTRRHVAEVASRLGYSASRTARNLNAGRTGTIVLAISSMSTDHSTDLQAEWDIEYFFRILSGASARAFSRGYLLSIMPFHKSSHDFLASTDGLILVDPSENDALLDAAIQFGTSCVTVGRNSRAVSWVDNDFFAGTTGALQHLAATHKSRPAMFLCETSSSYVRDELSAYLEWCSTWDVQPVIIKSPGPGINEAEPVMRAALESADRKFDAVITTLDSLALATERSARLLSLDVPEQLQILSLTDGRYLSSGIPVSISALDLHPVTLGEMASDILIDEIEGKTVTKREIAPTSLRNRGSTQGETL
jgi:DNA-binding LacI/PurR family transcriptional regulator